MKKLDVLYTADHKYLDIMMGSILSLIINSNIDNLRLHIVTSEFELTDYKHIEEIISNYPGVEVYFYDMKSIGIEKYNIPNWRGTQIANARLFFQDLLKGELSSIDNLLYLDSDTIVVSELDGLLDYNNSCVSAVKENSTKRSLDEMGLEKYFNSGVLMFNIDKWTNGNYQDRIIHFLENTTLPLTYPDQDTINCAINADIKEMPINYNLSTGYFLFGKLLKFYYYNADKMWLESLIEGKKDPKIIHCTGIWGIKAWTNNNINPWNEEFMKYILLGNPEFIKPDINEIKQMITKYPWIFKSGILIKSHLPEPAQKLVRKITSKLN